MLFNHSVIAFGAGVVGIGNLETVSIAQCPLVPVEKFFIKLIRQGFHTKGFLNRLERIEAAIFETAAKSLVQFIGFNKIGIAAPCCVFARSIAIVLSDKTKPELRIIIVKNKNSPVFKIFAKHFFCNLILLLFRAAFGEIAPIKA